MSSESRRQATQDLCARIDQVVSGHEHQRMYREQPREVGVEELREEWGLPPDALVSLPIPVARDPEVRSLRRALERIFGIHHD